MSRTPIPDHLKHDPQKVQSTAAKFDTIAKAFENAARRQLPDADDLRDFTEVLAANWSSLIACEAHKDGAVPLDDALLSPLTEKIIRQVTSFPQGLDFKRLMHDAGEELTASTGAFSLPLSGTIEKKAGSSGYIAKKDPEPR